MKKILFITKNFPPEIGGGIRRIEAVYNIFSNNKKVLLDVITAVKADPAKYPNVKYVGQLFFKDKTKSAGVSFRKSHGKIKLIDKALIGWVPNVLLNIIFKKYDYVFVSAPSFSNIIAGFIYKKLKFNSPKLIIEYRDFFSFNPSFINNFKKKFFNILERIILKNSNFVITTTGAMSEILSKYVNKNKIFLVRNSIAENDMEKVDKLKKMTLDDSYYNIGYIGKLNTGRDPSSVLGILNNRIDNKKVKLFFVGTNDSEKEFILEKVRLMQLDEKRISFEGVVDREKSLVYMKSFDGLILIINNEALIKDGYGIPGKLYDYIYVNNNIFSDKNTFKNLTSEFECRIKKEFNNFVNFSINHNEKLDDTFNNVIEEVVK